MKKQTEIRSYIDLDNIESDSRQISGIIPYNRESLPMGFTEILRAGCFAKSIAESKNIRMLYNHDDSRLVGATRNGSLVLEDTTEGLRFSCTVPETSDGDDLLALVRGGYISQCSFGFIVIRDNYYVQNGIEYREILEAKLLEISPCGDPAYPDTVVWTRSLSQAYEGKEDLTEEDQATIKAEIEKLQAKLPKEEPKEEPKAEEPQGPSQEELDAIQARIEAAAARIAELEK